MRILILASYDSFLNIAGLIGPYFAERGCEIRYALVRARVKKQISPEQIVTFAPASPLEWIDIESFCTSGRVAQFDIVVSCLEGLSMRRLTHCLGFLGARRPLVISVYPGLVIRYPYDGYAVRSGSDLLWLNCRKDLEAYEDMCFAFGLNSDNARLFGIPSLLQPIARQHSADHGPIVFFEQAIIPRYREERSYLARELVRLAKRNPAWTILVKPRATGSQATLHRTMHAITPLLETEAEAQGGWPSNLEVTSEKASRLLARASHCLTITSTVALEALQAGVPTIIIGDFGAHDDYGLHYFFRSGLVKTFAEIAFPLDLKPKDDWISRYVSDPNLTIRALVTEAVELAKSPRTAITDDRLKAEMSHELRVGLHNSVGISSTLDRRYQRPAKRRSLFRFLWCRVLFRGWRQL